MFLNPDFSALAKPEELPGVVEAADTIIAAVRHGQQIVVFGDYDCDGICATAIMVSVIKAIGGKVEPFLPKRLEEGYGMSESSVKRMLKDNPTVSLVVTVDNGINTVDLIAQVKAKGIEVVVTDHHLPGEIIPDTIIVNPKVSAPPHLDSLCGAGVAFLIANRIMSVAREIGLYDGPSVGGPLLVLAGLATVTDIMPLLGQNRIIVYEALNRFRSWAPLGLKELIDRASRVTSLSGPTCKDFGFLIGPRINAAGRMANGIEALELLLADDREVARECARIVDMRNIERKSVEQAMLVDALGKLVEGASAQVLDVPNGHHGVSGIVAARIMDRLGGVPVCVVVEGRGSARAPDGYNVRDALAFASDTLECYGGHAAAAGFTVKEGRIDEFRKLFCEACKTQNANIAPAAKSHGGVDVWVAPSDLNVAFAEQLAWLEPFGECNPEPVFGFHSIRLGDPKPLGVDGKHLVMQLGGFKAIWWGRGDMVEVLRANPAPRDVAFTLALSDYGERHIELRIVSMTIVSMDDYE